MKSLLCLIALYFIAAGSALAAKPPLANDNRDPVNPLDDPIGAVFQVGSTWYDMQHNSTAGRTIASDAQGNVHIVWTNGQTPNNSSRHIFYNVWNPHTEVMDWADGTQVDQATRAGFATVAVAPAGWAYPVFHELTSSQQTLMQSAMDFDTYAGAFIVTQPNPPLDGEVVREAIWPKIAIDGSGTLHAVSSNTITEGFFAYYSRGVPTFDLSGYGLGVDWQPMTIVGEDFRFVDTTIAVSIDIAASRLSGRVAIAYTRLREGARNLIFTNSDVFVVRSDDGGLNWDPPVNITNFSDVDEQRAFNDLSIVFDENDDLQLAFTSCYFWELPDSTFGYSNYRSHIWHWNEATNIFNVVATDVTEGVTPLGQGFLNVCRPSLSVDPVTDYLYCAYRKFSQDSWSDTGFAGSDIFVSVSADGGANWSVGRNVTDTTPTTNPCLSGDCMNERDNSLSDRVTYRAGAGYLNLMWVLDYYNGTALFGEGTATLNDVHYQRINVTDIPLTPFVPEEPLHNDFGSVDDLTILHLPLTDGFSLQWSPVIGADQYHIYKSVSHDDIFAPENYMTSVSDTFYLCDNCFALSPNQEYFGVISENLTALASRTGAPQSNMFVAPQR